MSIEVAAAKKMLTLISKDGQQFPVSDEIAAKSKLLSKRFLFIRVGELPEFFPLPTVDGWTLKKILEWCKAGRMVIYKEPESLIVDLTEEDEEYLKDLTADQLVALLLAADDLGIEHLAALVGKKIVDSIPDSTNEELDLLIRKCSPAEEEAEIWKISKDCEFRLI